MKYLAFLFFAVCVLGGSMLFRFLPSAQPVIVDLLHQTLPDKGVHPVQFISAGVPAHEFSIENPLPTFIKLSEHNVRIFYPTFQYQEVPDAKSLGYESDFLTLCKEPNTVHDAMAQANVTILLPLEVWYPADAPLPSVDADPLLKFINCIGREHIAGVTTYDEALHVGVPIEQVKALYERVKEIDPSLPVFMVHAYVFADSDETMTEPQRQKYFEDVLRYSVYADVVGFDVYAIPSTIAKVTTPYASGDEVTYDVAVEDYLRWLAENIPEKQHWIVLQGFAFADQYSEAMLAELPQELVDSASVAPTVEETVTMVHLAQKYNVEYVVWWGQSLLKKNVGVWESILKTTQSLKK